MTETYAAQVVEVLREHFPDLNDPVTAAAVSASVEYNARHPAASFEVIVDDPLGTLAAQGQQRRQDPRPSRLLPRTAARF